MKKGNTTVRINAAHTRSAFGCGRVSLTPKRFVGVVAMCLVLAAGLTQADTIFPPLFGVAPCVASLPAIVSFFAYVFVDSRLVFPPKCSMHSHQRLRRGTESDVLSSFPSKHCHNFRPTQALRPHYPTRHLLNSTADVFAGSAAAVNTPYYQGQNRRNGN